MSLGFPLGLLALLGVPVLVAAYFLRRRQRPRPVSALFLWRSPSQRAQAGPRFERLSREASLLLESLAVLAAALYLADARCGAQAERAHRVVVLDGGLSMNAREGGRSAADRARDAVREFSRRERATALTLVESGVKPRLLAGPEAEVERALAALEGWAPLQPAHDLAPALALASELAGRGQRVLLLTDGPLPEGTALAPSLEVRSVGASLDNAALVSAQRRDEGGVATLTVRVALFAKAAAAVAVTVKPEGGPAQTERVSLEPGQSGTVKLKVNTQGPIELSLPDDALREDNRATLLAAPSREVGVAQRVGLDGAAKAALERFLAAAPDAVADPKGALSFGPPGSAARVTLGATAPLKAFVGPFFTQRNHPLFDDLPLAGVVWAAGVNPPGRPLATAGEVVLVSEEDDGRVHLNLELSRSNLQRTAAWPVLLENLVRLERAREVGVQRRQLNLGDELEVVTAPGARWALRHSSGEERPVLAAGAARLPPLPLPGRWALLKDGAEVDALVVLPLDARESDLRARGPFDVEPTLQVAVAGAGLSSPRAFWPLLVLLLLVVADFWLTARRR